VFDILSGMTGEGGDKNSVSLIRGALEKGQSSQGVEGQFRRKSGEHFPVEYTVTPVRHHKHTTGAVLVFRDISQRKAAEDRMHEQAAMLENAHDAICTIDLDARIRYWNKGAETLYGWSRDEAVGQLAHKILFKKKSSSQHTTAFHELLEKDQWQGELQQITKSKREITTDSRWTLLRDKDGCARSILIINTDITERKNLEMQFLRAQRLESIGRLAGGIAHDLNNILAPIRMIVPLLREKLTDPQDVKMLDTVEGSSLRGAELVRQVLSFSRGKDGNEGEVNICNLISEQLRIIRQTFPVCIETTSRVTKDLWPITGNSTQIFQILMNLCINARDAMPKGGKLEIEAENTVIDPEYARHHADANPGRHVVITVSDTGTGIGSETIKKIFSPYFSTKRSGKGTGLGLSIVQTIVKNHHGHLEVHSEKGKGTTFRVYLPAARNAPAPSDPGAQNDPPRGRGEWILIVDDEETIIEIATTLLEHAGYKVLTASDGTEALARYSHYKDRISLVITDVMMPSMDGTAVVRTLREINPQVQILGITGMIEDTMPSAFLAEAGVPCLLKPICPTKLLHLISTMLAARHPGKSAGL